MSSDSLENQISELKRIRIMTGLNRTQFCKNYGIPLRSMEQWEAGQRKMPDYVLRLLKYMILSEKILHKQQYYDCSTCLGATSIIAQRATLLPAGTSVYSMPESAYNDEYRIIQEKYGVSFIFDYMKVECPFYAVPRFDVMAIDHEGGYIGMLGAICDLEDNRPVYYIDKNKDTFMIVSNAKNYLNTIEHWKETMIPTNDIQIFESRKDAEVVYSIIDMD